MARGQVKLPDDSANAGPKVRIWSRSLDAENRIEHFFHVVHGETAATANVAASGSNQTLQAANLDRTGWMVTNDSPDSVLYVKLGATASLTSYSKAIAPKGDWVLPLPYCGIIDGIWDNPSGGAVSGNARVTEVSP